MFLDEIDDRLAGLVAAAALCAVWRASRAMRLEQFVPFFPGDALDDALDDRAATPQVFHS